ncbi:hypothetical protein C8Q73DRAFT_288061 [Cubamyces lactineus]|nr:hypothetical protein C8Q73DRAFT_288061 [Cubamyces lactineus]
MCRDSEYPPELGGLADRSQTRTEKAPDCGTGASLLLGATPHPPEVDLAREAKGRWLARNPIAILGVANGKLPFYAFSDRRTLSIASRRLMNRALVPRGGDTAEESVAMRTILRNPKAAHARRAPYRSHYRGAEVRSEAEVYLSVGRPGGRHGTSNQTLHVPVQHACSGRHGAGQFLFGGEDMSPTRPATFDIFLAFPFPCLFAVVHSSISHTPPSHYINRTPAFKPALLPVLALVFSPPPNCRLSFTVRLSPPLNRRDLVPVLKLPLTS